MASYSRHTVRTSKEKLAAAACNASLNGFGRGGAADFYEGEKFSKAFHEKT